MASVLGLAVADYAASKAALVSLNDSLRYELDKRYKTPNIRTTLVIAGHTHTRLFSRMNLPSPWYNRFFTPSLQPHAVAKAIIAAMDEQESQMVFLPFYTHFVRWTTILPSYLRDLFQWVSGADYAMMGFVKVSGRRPEEGELAMKTETQKSK